MTWTVLSHDKKEIKLGHIRTNLIRIIWLDGSNWLSTPRELSGASEQFSHLKWLNLLWLVSNESFLMQMFIFLIAEFRISSNPLNYRINFSMCNIEFNKSTWINFNPKFQNFIFMIFELCINEDKAPKATDGMYPMNRFTDKISMYE